MNLESDLKKIIENFAPISLSEMDSVKLMRRIDYKFVLSVDKLPILLKKALVDYYILEVEGIREQIYETTYFDTNDYQMYTNHHNGKQNRCKIRVRKYVCSEIEFLEVKRKNNKGETIKNRIVKPYENEQLDFEGSAGFIQKFTPYNDQILWPKLGNSFVRVTMVNKDMSERVTIDYQLKFSDLKYHKQIFDDTLCIIEIKRDYESKKSSFLSTLNEMKIYPGGLSKYCIGLAMLNPEVKKNLFKQKMRELAKLHNK
jgi:hypothetical protein